MTLRSLLLLLALSAGCTPGLSRLPAPQSSGASDAPTLQRLDPEVMTRYLAAQLALAQPPVESGEDPAAEEAVRLIQQALALQNDAPELWLALADARARSGDFPAAAAAAREAVSLAPEDARARYKLGELLHRLGELPESAEHLAIAAALGLGGDDPHLAHYYLYFVRREMGDVDGALAALDAWMRALPEDGYATVLRARLLQEDGRTEAARAAALDALHQNPGSEDALTVYLDSFRIAVTSESRWTYQDAVRVPDAIAGLEEILRADWSRARLHRILVSLYKRVGRYDKASEHLRFIAILRGDRRPQLQVENIELQIWQHKHAEARRLIASARAREGIGAEEREELTLLEAASYEAAGELEQALRVLGAVPPESPRFGAAAVDQVRILLRRGESAQAASAAITARAALPPGDRSAHAALQELALEARLEMGDLAGARLLLPELERLDPDRGTRGRTQVLLAEGEAERAIGLLRDRLGKEPLEQTLVAELARVLAEQGDLDAALQVHDDAEAALDRWEKQRGAGQGRAQALEVSAHAERRRIELWQERARLLEAQDRLPDAIAVLERVRALRPQNGTVLNFLGFLLVEANQDLDEAEEHLTEALAQRPFSGAVIDSMGWLRYRQGRLDEAAELLEKANRFVPGEPELLQHLGEVYAAQGRIAEAATVWREALGATRGADELAGRIRDDLRRLEAQGER